MASKAIAQAGNHKAHVILIAYYYPPLNVIGALRPFRFHKYLNKLGYTCEVITSVPQAGGPGDDIIPVPDKTAALWDGNPAGEQPSFAYHIERIARKVALPGHVGLSWSWEAAAAAMRLARRQRGRKVVLITTYPPISVLLAGLYVSRKLNLPWIADFRDPMALDPFLPAKPALLKTVLSYIEGKTFQRASAVIANTSSAAESWAKVYPEYTQKVTVIWNGYDPEDQAPTPPLPERAHKLLIHTGTLYGGRNANMVVEALSRFRSRPGAPPIRLKLVGDIGAGSGMDAGAYQKAVAEGWLEFLPQRVPRAEAQHMAGEADGLLLIQPSRIQVPAKLYDYICIGRPILAIAYPDSAAHRVLVNCGIPFVLISPEAEPSAMDAGLAEFFALSSAPKPSSEWFREQFDVARQAQQLASMIDRVS